MRQAIWKFPLELEERQNLILPVGHRVLSVGLDGTGALCLWAVVNPDERARSHFTVWIVGTGSPADGLDPARYEAWLFLGTVTMQVFVWHIFQQTATA